MALIVARLPQSIFPDPFGATLPDNTKAALGELCVARKDLLKRRLDNEVLYETHAAEFAALIATEDEAMAGLCERNMHKAGSFQKKEDTIKRMQENLEGTRSTKATDALGMKIEESLQLLKAAEVYRQMHEQAVQARHAFECKIGMRSSEKGQEAVAVNGERQPDKVGDAEAWKREVGRRVRSLFFADTLGLGKERLRAKEGAQLGGIVFATEKTYQIYTDANIKPGLGTQIPSGVTANLSLLITEGGNGPERIVATVWTHLDVAAIADSLKQKIRMVEYFQGEESITFESRDGSFVVPLAEGLTTDQFLFCVRDSERGRDPLFDHSQRVSLLETLISTPGLENSHLEDPCRRDEVYDDVVNRFLEQQHDLQAKVTFVLKLFEDGRVLHPADDVLVGCEGER